jgi:hypothetical protein
VPKMHTPTQTAPSPPQRLSKGTPMTYTQARMIVWNPDAYSVEQVRKAISFILGTLSARREDVDRAMGIA